MRIIFWILIALTLLATVSKNSFAQSEIIQDESLANSTNSAIATKSAKIENQNQIRDLTSPEQRRAQEEFLILYQKRPINEPDVINIGGFVVQYAVRNGVPVNTIILILLLPALATLFVFFRQIIGIPTLELLVPIALSITLIATGLKIGIILLAAILLASIISRFVLRRLRIMQLPKMALSMLLVSIFVFLALVATASFALLPVNRLGFMPVLLLILLSDKIVALQLARGSRPAITITVFTLILAAIGYSILTFEPLRSYILLWPEAILVLIPLNIIIGRYFGLRLTEYHRFQTFQKYVNK